MGEAQAGAQGKIAAQLAPDGVVAPSDELINDAEEIFALQDLSYTDVPVRAWGGRKIRIRALTAGEAIDAAKTARDMARRDDSDIFLIAKCAITVDGTPMFTGEKQVEKLKLKNMAALKEIGEAIEKLNELGDHAKKN